MICLQISDCCGQISSGEYFYKVWKWSTTRFSPCWICETMKRTVWFPGKTLHHLFPHPHRKLNDGNALNELKKKNKKTNTLSRTDSNSSIGCDASECVWHGERHKSKHIFKINLTYCRNSWCHPRPPAEGWIQLSVSGVQSNQNPGRKDAVWPLRLHLHNQYGLKKILFYISVIIIV